ncbi:MAG: hypothetical protein ACK40V_09425, partial [Anaerolineales bacterium]
AGAYNGNIFPPLVQGRLPTLARYIRVPLLYATLSPRPLPFLFIHSRLAADRTGGDDGRAGQRRAAKTGGAGRIAY